MKPFLTLKSVDEVLALMREAKILNAEVARLDQLCGRRLADDFYAPASLPGFNRSTVDGFAARARDLFGASEGAPALLRNLGSIPMGAVPRFDLGEGETCGVFTGGMLPKGADCVVMIEYSRQIDDNLLEIIHAQAPGDNIVAFDEDAKAGTMLITAGKLLRPQEIGCLAAFGVEQIRVIRAAKVAILSTGDEIVPVDQSPPPGHVRNVNSHSLAALCRQAGADVIDLGIIPDDAAILAAKMAQALPEADVLVVSGGTSAGMRDHTVDCFQSLPDAKLLVHGVAISPGKPFIYATSGQKSLLGLPGHVSSALVCARVFLSPLINRLQGALEPEPVPVIYAKLTRSIASAQGRRDYIRCRLTQTPNGYEATPITLKSAVISGLVEADGLVVCPENREGLLAGENVAVEPV